MGNSGTSELRTNSYQKLDQVYTVTPIFINRKYGTIAVLESWLPFAADDDLLTVADPERWQLDVPVQVIVRRQDGVVVLQKC